MSFTSLHNSGTDIRRVFVASRPPDDILTLYNALKSSLGYDHWKWMRPRNLHITACFIGNVHNDALDSLGVVLGEAVKDFGPLKLKSEGLRWMPEKKPRMLWWRFQKNEAFSALHKALHKAAQPFKLQEKSYEQHPWPHITLARFKGMRPEKLPSLPDQPNPGDFEIEELALWLSVNEDGQTNYQVTPWQFKLLR